MLKKGKNMKKMKKYNKAIVIFLFFLANYIFPQNNEQDPNEILIYYEPFDSTVTAVSAKRLILRNQPYCRMLNEINIQQELSEQIFQFYTELIKIIDSSEIVTKVQHLDLSESIDMVINDKGEMDFIVKGSGKIYEVEVNLKYVNARLVIVFLNQQSEKMNIFGIGRSGVFSFNDKIYKANQEITVFIYQFLLKNNIEGIKEDFIKHFQIDL
jgi:hypothetical protein